MSKYAPVDVEQPVDDALLAESVEMEPPGTKTFGVVDTSSSNSLKYVVAAFCAILLLALLTSSGGSAKDSPPPVLLEGDHRKLVPKDRVPVDLYVMSQCPDAVLCEKIWEDVVDDVEELMTINTHYIATIEGDTVTCKHGENECMGNKQQLCAHHLFKQALANGDDDEVDDDDLRRKKDKLDVNQWFQFVHCQSEHVHDIPKDSLLEKCVKKIKSKSVTADAIRQCVTSQGNALAKASAQSCIDRDARRSCTMYVANKLRCVHDGGWQNCEGGNDAKDFARDICKEYAARHPDVVLPKACRK